LNDEGSSAASFRLRVFLSSFLLSFPADSAGKLSKKLVKTHKKNEHAAISAG